MTKPTEWHVHPAKTQISLGIRLVWSESSLSARRKLGYLAIHWARRGDQARTQTFENRVWIKGFYKGGANLNKILIWRPKLGV